MPETPELRRLLEANESEEELQGKLTDARAANDGQHEQMEWQAALIATLRAELASIESDCDLLFGIGWRNAVRAANGDAAAAERQQLATLAAENANLRQHVGELQIALDGEVREGAKMKAELEVLPANTSRFDPRPFTVVSGKEPTS